MERRTFDYRGMKFAYYYSAGGSGTALLMHGYSFNSQVWEDVGLVEALNRLGLDVIGMDVPGFPQSMNRLALNEKEIVSLLEAMAATLPGDLFLLGSSASAHIAMEFAQRAGDRLSGLILVAPVSVKNVALERISAKVLAVWGSEDDVSPAYKTEDAIKSIKGSETAIINGAGHACYLRQPEAFIKIVSEFISRNMGR